MKILFFDNSTDLQTIHDLDTHPRGGMVSSLFLLTDELSRRGHDVSVLSDVKVGGKTKAGVYWGSSQEMGDSVEWDVLVCNRGTTNDGMAYVTTKKRVLWTHDLPHAGFIPNPSIFR